MVEYLIRIVSAWALLRLASLVVKDAENLLKVSAQRDNHTVEADETPVAVEE